MIWSNHFLSNLPATLKPFESAFKALLDITALQKLHGEYNDWQRLIDSLPAIRPSVIDLARDALHVGTRDDCSDDIRNALIAALRKLHPWRKGPFDIFGIDIDTEWRSDWKWQRVLPHIAPLKDRIVLDVGCGSGYHCFRMRGEGARFVVGIDPTVRYLFQFLALNHYINDNNVHFLPLKSEDMPRRMRSFDTVFSMGVLYHRRAPFDHLDELKDLLRPGGELVLETLVMPGPPNTVVVPRDRYAQMRNVWFLPSAETLPLWLQRAGFENARVVDISRTTPDEQRKTDWMTFQSLQDFLDPTDPNFTIEGLPAPTRAIIIANKPNSFAK
jgi:tRNA (mo5U34)-methyltransferase